MNPRKRVSILHSDIIEQPIVDAHPPLIIRLRDEENREAPRALRRLNDLLFEKKPDLTVLFISILLREWIV